MKILIVDDHILFREGLTSVLRSHPEYPVIGEAGSVSEAIQKARQLKPDMILMDFNLPDGSGAEAAKVILAEDPQCKIIFLTMFEANENLFAAIRSGAKGYLLKNLQVPTLLACLKALERGETVFSHAMTGQIIEEFARMTSEGQAETEDKLDRLSYREKEVLRELTSGATNQEIGLRLCLSENTVRHHIHHILEKLDLDNRREAANFAKKHGIVTGEK
jgi:two-component system NarL family response regulator